MRPWESHPYDFMEFRLAEFYVHVGHDELLDGIKDRVQEIFHGENIEWRVIP